MGIRDDIIFGRQSNTPSVPTTGSEKLYTDEDGTLKRISADGMVTNVESGDAAMAAAAAALLRANHTGTQAISTIVGLQAQLDLRATKNGDGTNFVVVDVSADNAVTNGSNLLAAYAATKLLTPNGAVLQPTNRATVIIPPGVFDLGTTPLALDTQYVDIVGLTGDPKHVIIKAAVVASNSGTVVQTANNVRCRGITVDWRQTSGTSYVNGLSSDPACYAPSTNLNNTIWEDCIFGGDSTFFLSMRVGIIYSGTFIRCTANTARAFGSYTGGVFSGTATDCVCANSGFGGGSGTCSGTCTRCVAGASSFGGDSGALTGKLYNCRILAGGGAFPTVSGAGITRLCINGSDVEDNQG